MSEIPWQVLLPATCACLDVAFQQMGRAAKCWGVSAPGFSWHLVGVLWWLLVTAYVGHALFMQVTS